MENVTKAKRPVRLPVVLTAGEVRAILARLDGQHWLMASLLYGAGPRLLECVWLRAKDIDFEYGQITVRNGKGNKDPGHDVAAGLVEPLRAHLEKVKDLHNQDLAVGFGEVYLPYALDSAAPGHPCPPRHTVRPEHSRSWASLPARHTVRPEGTSDSFVIPPPRSGSRAGVRGNDVIGIN